MLVSAMFEKRDKSTDSNMHRTYRLLLCPNCVIHIYRYFWRFILAGSFFSCSTQNAEDFLKHWVAFFGVKAAKRNRCIPW